MKESPILFSTPMVQAILAGRKTQTRRIVPLKNQENNFIGHLLGKTHESEKLAFGRKKNVMETISLKYHPGDLLWVRETFQYGVFNNPILMDEVAYKADGNNFPEMNELGWRPSIHMPKKAARIWLKVTDISLQRVKEISAEDAIKEGIKNRYNHTFQETRYFDYQDLESEWRSPVSSFMSLWCSIHGEENWDMNPWVWVIEFEVISTSGKPEFYSVRGNLLVNPVAPNKNTSVNIKQLTQQL